MNEKEEEARGRGLGTGMKEKQGVIKCNSGTLL